MFGKYKQGISVIILLAAFVLVIATPLNAIVKLIIMMIALAVIALSTRGNALYAKANRITTSRDMSRIGEAVTLYGKAVKAGIAAEYQLMAGTVILQHGEIEEGRAILEKLVTSSKKDIRCTAKLSLSMYWWIKEDAGRAIALCNEVKDEGFRNQNLYVDLCTYYLGTGNRKQFQKTLREAFSNNLASVPLIDLQAVNHMLQGDWNEAGRLLKSLFSQATPSFPDPYVHMAQFKLHYGNVRDALTYLKSGLDCIFCNTTLYKKDMLEKMITGLEDGNSRISWAEGINGCTEALVNGKLPEPGQTGSTCADMLLPGYPKEPEFKNAGENPISVARGLDDDDDGDVDTDLNEEDEKWIRKHSGR